MTDESDKPLYDDSEFVEVPISRLPSPYPNLTYFNIRQKSNGSMFRVLADGAADLAVKILAGDWESDPGNKPATDEEEDD